MNGRLKAWVKDNYPASKADLFAMFMDRALALTVKQGEMADDQYAVLDVSICIRKPPIKSYCPSQLFIDGPSWRESIRHKVALLSQQLLSSWKTSPTHQKKLCIFAW